MLNIEEALEIIEERGILMSPFDPEPGDLFIEEPKIGTLLVNPMNRTIWFLNTSKAWEKIRKEGDLDCSAREEIITYSESAFEERKRHLIDQLELDHGPLSFLLDSHVLISSDHPQSYSDTKIKELPAFTVMICEKDLTVWIKNKRDDWRLFCEKNKVNEEVYSKLRPLIKAHNKLEDIKD